MFLLCVSDQGSLPIHNMQNYSTVQLMLKRSANREDIYKTNQNITLINTNE